CKPESAAREQYRPSAFGTRQGRAGNSDFALHGAAGKNSPEGHSHSTQSKTDPVMDVGNMGSETLSCACCQNLHRRGVSIYDEGLPGKAPRYSRPGGATSAADRDCLLAFSRSSRIGYHGGF